MLQSSKENKTKRNIAKKKRTASVAADDPLKNLPLEGSEAPIIPVNGGAAPDVTLSIRTSRCHGAPTDSGWTDVFAKGGLNGATKNEFDLVAV